MGELTLFPANVPPESVFIDILGELLRTPRGNRYLLVIVDQFTKLRKTVPLKNISASSVSRAFIIHWVFSFGPLTDLISDNGKHFTSKFFLDVCLILKVQNAFRTTCHPQTAGGKIKPDNRVRTTRLHRRPSTRLRLIYHLDYLHVQLSTPNIDSIGALRVGSFKTTRSARPSVVTFRAMDGS